MQYANGVPPVPDRPTSTRSWSAGTASFSRNKSQNMIRTRAAIAAGINQMRFHRWVSPVRKVSTMGPEINDPINNPTP